QFILDAPRNENRRRHFRMRVIPFLSRQRSLIFEHAYILEPRILLQIRDPQAPHPQHTLDFLITQLCKFLVVLPRLNHKLVRTQRPHLVVNTFGGPAGIILHAVQRSGVWYYAPLPYAFRGPRQNGFGAFHDSRIEGTLSLRALQLLSLSAYNP